jgi:hypothetical protein
MDAEAQRDSPHAGATVAHDGRCSLRGGHLPRRASSSRTVTTNASERSISSCECPSARRRLSISASVIPPHQSSRYRGTSLMDSIVDHRVATSAHSERSCIQLLNLSVSLLRQRRRSLRPRRSWTTVTTWSRRQRTNTRTTVTHISRTTNNRAATTICFRTKNVSIGAPRSVNGASDVPSAPFEVILLEWRWLEPSVRANLCGTDCRTMFNFGTRATRLVRRNAARSFASPA